MKDRVSVLVVWVPVSVCTPPEVVVVDVRGNVVDDVTGLRTLESERAQLLESERQARQG